MCYHIQLPHATSTESYCHTTDNPLHGPGQGSRAAPSLWVIISSIIMHCMEQKSNGLSFTSPKRSINFKHIMTGFVDDTTHWLNNFTLAIQGQYSQYEMYMTTQQTAQWWEQLLHATGGKLELQKCFYYPIIWKFNEEGIPELLLTSENRQVTMISSETGNTVTIQKKMASESHKTLGIYENPSGEYNDEYQNILRISTNWTNKIRNQYLT